MLNTLHSTHDLSTKKTGQDRAKGTPNQTSDNEAVLPVKELELPPAAALIQEMLWLRELIELRCAELRMEDQSLPVDQLLTPPPLADGHYAELVRSHKLDELGRVMLALGVAVEYDQSIFELMMLSGPTPGHPNVQMGGQIDRSKNMFLPTFQTALFLLSGNNQELRATYTAALSLGHVLLQEQVIYSGNLNGALEHHTQGIIELDDAYYRYLLTGQKPRLDHGKYFPATLYTTGQTMDDIVVNERVFQALKPLGNYMLSRFNRFYEQGHHAFKKGFIALFYGAPGTGKTLLAGILANTYGLDMYRVDLSQVVSKYIGETEKNLEVLFNRLQGQDCILFFDEADALFGKRSDVQDAKDRFANQEVSYLLQRIEQFDGLTILATNYENNMDEAFMRRINVMINMARPAPAERKALWSHFLPEGYQWVNDRLLQYLADQYGYTGANIRNVVEMLALEMHENDLNTVTLDLLEPYLIIENIKAFGINESRLKEYKQYGNLNEGIKPVG